MTLIRGILNTIIEKLRQSTIAQYRAVAPGEAPEPETMPLPGNDWVPEKTLIYQSRSMREIFSLVHRTWRFLRANVGAGSPTWSGSWFVWPNAAPGMPKKAKPKRTQRRRKGRKEKMACGYCKVSMTSWIRSFKTGCLTVETYSHHVPVHRTLNPRGVMISNRIFSLIRFPHIIARMVDHVNYSSTATGAVSPSFTRDTSARPMRNRSATERIAGRWLPNARDISPNRTGPMMAADLPTMA